MSAGTISIQNNAAAVAGDGTVFTTELSAGDFIVITTGGVTYTLPVKSVESDIALTLARNYNGPAVTGAAWTAMPRDTLNRISAQIAADTAYAIRQRVLEIDNWYQLLEVNGDVTIKMADGSSYTGPSWLKLIDVMKEMKIDELIPIAEQIRADAQQVADDKPVIVQAKDDAIAAASAAAASEGNAATSESNAATSASTASEKAEEAAESARQAGASNPQLALQKSLNLADLEDRDEAWMNVRPDGPTPLAADPVDNDHAATKGWVEKFIASVRSVLASWSVINADSTRPAANTNITGGDLISRYNIGTALEAEGKVKVFGTIGGAYGLRLSVTNATKGVTKNFDFTDSGNIVTSGGFTCSGPVIASINGGTANNGTGGAYQAINSGGSSVIGERNDGGIFNSNVRSQNAFFACREFVGQSTNGVIAVNVGSTWSNFYFRNNGSAYAESGGWVNGASDIRVKRDFEEIKNPFSTMRKIKAGTWRMNTKNGEGRFGIGVLANGLYDDYPEAALDNGDQELADGTIVKNVLTVQAGDSGVLAAVHHASILQLMDTVKNALNTIAGITTDESAKAALEALAEKITAYE